MSEEVTSGLTTLGDYRDITATLFGEDSKATGFLDQRIAKESREAKVMAHETQMIYLISKLHFNGEKSEDE